MKTSGKKPIQNLTQEPFKSVLCYPKPTETETQNRISELSTLGVEAIEFCGQSFAFTVPVLGKGYVGVVVAAYVGGERYALKMRRVDADRLSLEREAELLKKANCVGVGPKFLAVSTNFLLMELVDGDLLAVWLETHKDKTAIKKVLADILEQCWRLDQAGLDHGELSKAPKHLLVDHSGKAFIVDFETASLERRMSNVTAVSQFLFQGKSDAAQIIAATFGQTNMEKLVAASRNYKFNQSRVNFEILLQVCLF